MVDLHIPESVSEECADVITRVCCLFCARTTETETRAYSCYAKSRKIACRSPKSLDILGSYSTIDRQR